jgi:DNA-binding beta-propeller fold protein YncE
MLAGCYSTGEGPTPSVTTLYFPVGMQVSPGGKALYVANSDFDLRFNAGTVAAYDLARMREYLRPLWAPETTTVPADPCLGLGINPTPILQPGACGPYDPNAPPDAASSSTPVVRQAAKIGAFATDLLFVCPPAKDGLAGGADCTDGSSVDLSHPGLAVQGTNPRLFVPVRGEPSLTFFDVDDDRPTMPGGQGTQSFRLDCDQSTNDGRCGDSHRVGVNAADNDRALTLPAEPFGIAVTDRAEAIVVSHQSSGNGALSLFTPQNAADDVLNAKPVLQFVYSGLPAATTGIAALPIPASATTTPADDAPDYHQGFVVTYREAPEADVFRFFDDAAAAPIRPFLTRTSIQPLSATPSGRDSRSVAIDHSPSSERSVCAAGCAPADATCLAGCATIPLDAYIANRAPASLLVGQVQRADPKLSTEEVHVFESVPLAQGPSRVVIGRIRRIKDGVPVFEKRVFVICFDARVIFVYDPVARQIDGTIRTGRGPHSLVMDPVEPIAYVGHFTDSYIGVIDLDQSHAGTFETIVASIGVPTPPSETK